MTTACPQCGARLAAGEACADRFALTQGREFERPAYFRVHHLSVPCYLLQHRHYAREGWLAARQLLLDCVTLGLTQAEASQRSRALLAGEARAWRIAGGGWPDAAHGIVWTRTIADVRLGSAREYCADVRSWAAAILADTAEITQRA